MALGQAKADKTVGRYETGAEVARSYLGPLYGVHADAGDGSTELGLLRLVSLARLDADTRVRLLEAAWQAMEVRHERILTVLDVVASDGELGIVSEAVPGQILRSVLAHSVARRKPMQGAVAFRIILDLLEGVSALDRFAAELGDEAIPLFGGVSPDSVLVGMSGRTSLLDVAIASAAYSVESLGGSPDRVAYAAPEQIASPPRADARSDVFAVGVLAWELLSNRRLFLGSDKGVAQKVLAAKIPPFGDAKRADEVPLAALAVVTTALARDPAERFQTADEMAARLRDAAPTIAEPAEVTDYLAGLKDGVRPKSGDVLGSKEAPARVSLGSRVQARRPDLPRLPSEKPLPAGTSGWSKGAVPKKSGLVGKPGTVRRATIIGVAPAPKTTQTAPRAAKASADAAPSKVTARPAASGAAQPASPDAVTSPPVSASFPSRSAPEAIVSPRARQPTMIGIAPPALPPLVPAPEFADASSGDDEPTLQYSARELLKQVEAVSRPTPASEEPDAREPSTAPPPPLELSPTEDGGWLDGPDDGAASVPTSDEIAELLNMQPLPTMKVVGLKPPEPGSPPNAANPDAESPEGRSEPASPAKPPEKPRVAPISLSPGASGAPRRTAERPPAPLSFEPSFPLQRSVPPPAVLSSQVPPPLIHDPRANRATSMPPPRQPGSERSMRGMLLGGVASLLIVTLTAVVGVFLLRGRNATGGSSLSSRANAVLAPEAPANPAQGGVVEGVSAPIATATAAPPPATDSVSAAPNEAPAEAPSAEAPGPGAANDAPPAPATTDSAPKAQALKAPAPAAPEHKAAPRAAPPSSRRQSKKKNPRYVPDDI